MHVIRKAILGLVASLLVTLLSAFGILFAVYQVFHTTNTIKHALNSSGVYKTVVGDALDQAQKEQASADNAGQIPINDPAIRSVIEEAVSPAFLQNQAEDALDAVYSWLQGKTPDLKLTVNLTDAKARLADGLGKYVQQRLATLPTCPAGASPAGEVDAFNDSCVPAGFDSGQAAAQAKSQVQGGEFLKDSTTLTADSIKTKDGKTLAQQLHSAPTIYKYITWAFYGLILLIALLVLGVVLLSATRRLGVKKAAVACVTTGFASAILAWLSSFGLKVAAEQLTKTAGTIQPLQQSLVQVAQIIVNDIRVWWMGYGIALLILGIAALVVLHFTKPKILATSPETTEPQPTSTPTATASPAISNPATTEPKPRPIKKLVQ